MGQNKFTCSNFLLVWLPTRLGISYSFAQYFTFRFRASPPPPKKGGMGVGAPHVHTTWTKLNWSSRTGVLNTCFPMTISRRTNWLNTKRPSFAAASLLVMTLTRVTNERVVKWVDLLQVSSVQFICWEQALTLDFLPNVVYSTTIKTHIIEN